MGSKKNAGISNAMILELLRQARKGNNAAIAELRRAVDNGVRAKGDAEKALNLLKEEGKL